MVKVPLSLTFSCATNLREEREERGERGGEGREGERGEGRERRESPRAVSSSSPNYHCSPPVTVCAVNKYPVHILPLSHTPCLVQQGSCPVFRPSVYQLQTWSLHDSSSPGHHNKNRLLMRMSLKNMPNRDRQS